ncbi:hypothetical protein EDD16DRAFT_1702623 [Pisolithus croceorrhizus]|nr:hypothetical protein EDD16DRAFT_1702623 [Pisolithus croceorrhizus]
MGGSSLDIQSDCAETEVECVKHEAEVVEVWQMEDYILEVEAWAVDSKRLDDGTNMLEAPGESSQHADDEVVESRNFPDGQGELPDVPSDCAETESGCARPEAEVIDAGQVEPHLTVGSVDIEQPNERADAVEAPDEKSQRVDDDVAKHRDSPDYISEAFESTGDMAELDSADIGSTATKLEDTSQKEPGKAADQDGPAKPQHGATTRTVAEQLTHTTWPSPTGTNYIHGPSKGLQLRERLKLSAENESRQAKSSMAVQSQPTWDNLPGREDNSSGGHDDVTSSGCGNSHGVEQSMLAFSGAQCSEREAKRLRRSPAPPAPSLNGIMDMPTPFTDPR